MIFVDAHVHIYDCFDVDFLLDSAWNNFQEYERQHGRTGEKAAYVLLLTAGRKETWLRDFLGKFGGSGKVPGKIARGWQFSPCAEKEAINVSRLDRPQENIYLVAGRQIITREKIEVLALFCTSDIADDMTLAQTIDAIRQSGAIPVLPWGVGKWFGQRGRMIREMVLKSGGVLYLGDNGGRPRIWPTPELFDFARETGVSVLPGTDPLPLTHEAARVGRFGFILPDEGNEDAPVSCLKDALLTGSPSIAPYGRLQGNGIFLLNQIRLKVAP